MALFLKSVIKELVENDLVDVLTILALYLQCIPVWRFFIFFFPFLTPCCVAKPVNNQSQML